MTATAAYLLGGIALAVVVVALALRARAQQKADGVDRVSDGWIDQQKYDKRQQRRD